MSSFVDALFAVDIAGASIGLSALLLSVAALTWTIVSTRRSTSTSETQNLRQQVEELKGQVIMQDRELQACKDARVDLQKQNFDLMMEIHQLAKKE